MTLHTMLKLQLVACTFVAGCFMHGTPTDKAVESTFPAAAPATVHDPLHVVTFNTHMITGDKIAKAILADKALRDALGAIHPHLKDIELVNYKVRILDRFYWGRGPLSEFIDQVELVDADVRDMPATALDGVDGVISLAGLSNDPTAEYDPEANWQMNAVATETLGRACVDRGVEKVVFASSCSLYDGLPRACGTRRLRSSRAAPTPPPSATARRHCSPSSTRACARRSCATAPCTATARGCASTSW